MPIFRGESEIFVKKIFTVVVWRFGSFTVGFSSICCWHDFNDTKLSIVIITKTPARNFILLRHRGTTRISFYKSSRSSVGLPASSTKYLDSPANFTYRLFHFGSLHSLYCRSLPRLCRFYNADVLLITRTLLLMTQSAS